MGVTKLVYERKVYSFENVNVNLFVNIGGSKDKIVDVSFDFSGMLNTIFDDLYGEENGVWISDYELSNKKIRIVSDLTEDSIDIPENHPYFKEFFIKLSDYLEDKVPFIVDGEDARIDEQQIIDDFLYDEFEILNKISLELKGE